MAIQRLRPGDRDRIREILIATAQFTPTETGWAMELVNAALRSAEEYEGWTFGDPEGLILGYVLFGPVARTEDVFDLYWIAVDSTHQGDGVGRQLLGFVEEEVRSRAGRMLLIETRGREGWERTHRFYRSAGYEEISRIKDFYRVEDDKIVFCKRLTSQ